MEKQLVSLREKIGFLGYEFLTWFFLQIKNNNSDNLKKEFELALGNKITTCLYENKDQKTSIANTLLEESYEVFASIKNGHLVESLSLVINLNGTIINLSISAKDSSLSQVKISDNFENFDSDDDLSEAEQNRENLFLRISALEKVEEILNTYFEKFLTERLSASEYDQNINIMKAQVEEFLVLANTPKSHV